MTPKLVSGEDFASLTLVLALLFLGLFEVARLGFGLFLVCYVIRFAHKAACILISFASKRARPGWRTQSPRRPAGPLFPGSSGATPPAPAVR